MRTMKDFKDIATVVEYPGVSKWSELPINMINGCKEAIARDLTKASHAGGALSYYYLYMNAHWSPESVLCNFGKDADIPADAKFTLKQNDVMRFSPIDGTERPYPSHAQQFRTYHGEVAWLYNPWSGLPRDARDIGTDVFGRLICND